ncbi:MAG: DUF4118 domain-containing protein, partial [Spirochaetia bacterium]|nr:DUF4118 domain-containing protein [Spirochaetia bacterium]
MEGETESESKKKILTSHLTLARELGAEVRLLPREEVAKALCDYAREIKADMILAGTPRRRFGFRPDPGRRLLKASRGLTVIFSEVAEDSKNWKLPAVSGNIPLAKDLLIALAAIGLTTLLGLLVAPSTGYGVVSFVYLLAVSLLAIRLGRIATLAAAGLGALLWDFLFIPPIYTFRIGRLEDGLMFGTFFAVAVIISHLTWRLKRRELFERKREERTRSLYRLAQSLAESVDLKESLSNACKETEKLFDLPCALWLSASNQESSQESQGVLKSTGLGTWRTGTKETSVAEWAFLHARAAGASTDTLPQSDGLFIPLRSGSQM